MIPHSQDVLDNCIELLRRGRSVDECLALYPDYADDLRPLLQAATWVAAQPKAHPSPAAMQAGLQAILVRAAEMRHARQDRPGNPWERLALIAGSAIAPTRPLQGAIRLGWATAMSVILILAMVMAGTSIANAASSSLPDEPLYTAKVLAEAIQVTITTNPAERASLHMALADRRLTEIQEQVVRRRPLQPETFAALDTQNAQALAAMASVPDETLPTLLERYVSLATKQEAVLTQVKAAVPPTLEPVVEHTLIVATTSAELAQRALANPAILRDGGGGQEAPAYTVAPSGTRTPTHLPTTTATPVSSPTKVPTDTPLPTATVIHLPVPSNTPTSVATPVSRRLVHLEGIISYVGATSWVIGGQTILVNETTRIANAARAIMGAYASATAVTQADGSLLAVSISVVSGEVVELRGVVTAMSGEQWIVGSSTIRITGQTAITGKVEVGTFVSVTALRLPDGTIIALSINTLADAQSPVTFSGPIVSFGAQAWTIGNIVVAIDGQTRIQGTPYVGVLADVRAIRQTDGTLVARSITVQLQEMDYVGIINSIVGNLWTVDDRMFLVDDATAIDDSLASVAAGRRAQVHAILLADGAWRATSIKVRLAAPSDRRSTPSPTVTSPLATPTPTLPPTDGPTPIPPTPPAAASPTPRPPSPTPQPSPTPNPERTPNPVRTPNPIRTPWPTSTPISGG